MNSITLTEEEIITIESLLDDMEKISAVECVYVKSSLEGQKEEPLVTITITIGHGKDSLKLFDTIISDYMEKFHNINGGRCDIKVELSKYYRPWFTTLDEMLYDEDLVNGTILFDRFGILTFVQEKAGENICKNTSLPVIENIDDLMRSKNKKIGI